MTWVVKQHECQLPELKEGRGGDIWRCDTCNELWCIKPGGWWALIFITSDDKYWTRANKRQRAAHPIKETR